MDVKLYLADSRHSATEPTMLKAFVISDGNYSQIFSDGQESEIPHNTHFVGYYEGQKSPEIFVYNECTYRSRECKSIVEAKRIAKIFFWRQINASNVPISNVNAKRGIFFKGNDYPKTTKKGIHYGKLLFNMVR